MMNPDTAEALVAWVACDPEAAGTYEDDSRWERLSRSLEALGRARP